MDYRSRIDEIRKTFKKRAVTLHTFFDSQFPELIVDIPDKWPVVKLAPLYDVHVGNKLHNKDLFRRHLKFLADDPHVICWNGGDLIENAILDSPGMFDQRMHPGEQFDVAAELLASIQHKMVFAIPGNHEARTANRTGFDIARHFADDLQIPYFPDYCFCTFRWRGHKFRGCIHHGSGAAATKGGQVNAARKDMPWVGCDFYWTGHLHIPNAEPVRRAEFDQDNDRLYWREAMVFIQPSYLDYFGGYAATKRYGPGVQGLTIAELWPNGNIQTTLHAKGKRR